LLHFSYVPFHLENTVRRLKHEPARTIYDAVLEDVFAFAAPADDVSLVVIKRN